MKSVAISKNKKIRNSAGKELDAIKNKFTTRFYNKLKDEIQSKRIDAVKRLIDSFKILARSNATVKNVKSGNFKETVKMIQTSAEGVIKTNLQKQMTRRVKNQSILIENPKAGQIFRELMELKKAPGVDGSVRVSLVQEGEVLKSFIVDLTSVRGDIYSTVWMDTSYNEIFGEYPDAKLIITKDANITPNRVAQAFKQGTTNCLFVPIINWAEMKRDTSATARTQKRYECLLKQATTMSEKFHDSGVNSEDLQGICDTLQINIVIKLPFSSLEPLLSVRCNKKALTTFEYINTKLNHVDGFNHNEITKECAPKQISSLEMEKKFNELKSKGDYFIFKRNHANVTSVSTVDTKYITKQDFNDFTNEFKKTTGLSECKICDIADYNLSQYVRASCNSNLTVDFIQTQVDPEDEIAMPDLGEYKCMDMEKAYKNVNLCKYFSGYLGKITDFRKTNVIQGLGIYTITNLILPEKFAALNLKMKIWSNGNPYPSPELQFLREAGATFDITEGCWGTEISFNFDNPSWMKYVDTSRVSKTRWYAKFVGIMESHGMSDSFYMNATPEYIQNLITYLPEEKFKTYDDEVRFIIDKTENKHLTHVASFIKSYIRINMMEQLNVMEISDIIRVCVDGIYYYENENKNYPHLNIFREEDKDIMCNPETEIYCSNYYNEYTWNSCDKSKEHQMTELHTGCGGGGKTYTNLVDTGNIRMLYISPSWKLARSKQKEHNIAVDVWYNLLCNDPDKYGRIRRKYNVLIVDEISMMSNEEKHTLLKRFSGLKIIMCGDPGFQLECIGDGTPFKCEGFGMHRMYNTNHRVTCDKLLFIINKIRNLIEAKYPSTEIKEYIKLNFKHITETSLKSNYKPEDMILTHTNIRKNELTNVFKHLDKYYVTENTPNYSNGDIIVGSKPPGCRSELRHAYTTHSIQGETAEHNLYIDIKCIHFKKMLYTALSRARTWDQIHLIM